MSIEPNHGVSAERQAHMREGDDNYPDVLAISADRKSRIIVSADTAPTTQWIVQRWDGCQWRSTNFCRSRIGMEIVVGSGFGGVVATLPGWCPQRPVKSRSKHTYAGKSGSKVPCKVQGALPASACGEVAISQTTFLEAAE